MEEGVEEECRRPCQARAGARVAETKKLLVLRILVHEKLAVLG